MNWWRIPLVWLVMFGSTLQLRRPVIGILSQPSSYLKFQSDKYSYIQSSYVKDLESAGALVIPLLYTWSDEILVKRMNDLDGLLLPGGGTNLKQINNITNFKEYTEYAVKGSLLIHQARKINDQGGYFPIWGTCLGFEQFFMSFTTYNNSLKLLKKLKGTQNRMRNVILNENPEIKTRSKILANMGTNLFNQLQKQDLFYFNHNFGILRKTFNKLKSIRNNWLAVAFNLDDDGNEFVSIAESTKYPFFGVQFHPEKITYDWSEDLNIKRDFYQVEAQQYFMNFFINQVKKQKYFKVKQELQYEENANLLNQAIVSYIGMDIYFFNNNMNNNLEVDDCVQKCIKKEHSFIEDYKIYILLIINITILIIAFFIQNQQLIKLQQEHFIQIKQLKSKQS